MSRLESARSQIEQRFLAGGEILISVLDVLNRLLSTLDNLAKSLDAETAQSTADQLAQTVSQISLLPQLEHDRQQRLEDVTKTEKALRSYVDDMQETLRYLRTFAITAKITGAGIEDFAGFAEEIIERIQLGSTQVNQLSANILALGATLGIASTRGRQTLEGYRKSVPAIVASLSSNVSELGAQRRHLADIAARVSDLTRKVQGRVSVTLSAMQIGDITRQRIEHCQAAFSILDAYLDSPEGRALPFDELNRLSLVIRHLVSQQLNQITTDFDRESGTIVGTIAGFNTDIAGLLELHGEMEPKGGAGTNSAMRILERDVTAARTVVGDIEKAADAANELGCGTIATVRELLDGVETIKLIRTDIQYMALNTNLRCSRLGEEGRAINVVTGELRGFAGKLDETAQSILEELQVLQANATKLGDSQSETDRGEPLDTKLENALNAIRSAGDMMEEDLVVLRGCGYDIATKVTASVAKLDYRAQLGDVLTGCAQQAADLAAEDFPPTDGLEAALSDVGGKIAKVYTMVKEREVHAVIFGSAAAAPNLTVVSNDEDDLFESALF
ncbi:hypothetical protein AX761_22510 [Rhizobium sp. 58]|nr:hypothetical protein AX761_22510 [Rhizobium sp. 58]